MAKQTVAIGETGAQLVSKLDNNFNELYNKSGGPGVVLSDAGAVGDGVTDDTAAIQAAINQGVNVFGEYGMTYLISDTISFLDAIYDFGNATVQATIGMATKAMFYVDNKSNFVLKNVVLECDNIAQYGLYASVVNSNNAIFENMVVKHATQDGVYFTSCMVTSVKNVYSLLNGRYGFFLNLCNQLVLNSCETSDNVSDGIYITIGGGEWSGGVRIINSTIQVNGGNGINNVDTTSLVTVKDCWIEGNLGHGVIVGEGTKTLVKDNYIISGGTQDKYAIYVSGGASGAFHDNQLPASAPFDGGHVYYNNTGLTGDEASNGVVITPNWAMVIKGFTSYVLAVPWE